MVTIGLEDLNLFGILFLFYWILDNIPSHKSYSASTISILEDIFYEDLVVISKEIILFV